MNLFFCFGQEVSVIVGIILNFDLHIVKLRSVVIFLCAFFSLQFTISNVSYASNGAAVHVILLTYLLGSSGNCL